MQTWILDTVETVRFLHHVLALAIERDLLKHPWVLGLVRACEQARPTLKQARVLAAREVLSLETLFIEGSLHKVDRFGLGCFLFLIFACCCLSAVSYLDSLALDVPDKALRSERPRRYVRFLRELVSVIRSVASGAFRPDESRSGQFVGVCASDDNPDGVARESATEEPAPVRAALTRRAFLMREESRSQGTSCGHVGPEGRMGPVWKRLRESEFQEAAFEANRSTAKPWRAAALRSVLSCSRAAFLRKVISANSARLRSQSAP